jgi:outer membrane lipoprotein carrier protein
VRIFLLSVFSLSLATPGWPLSAGTESMRPPADPAALLARVDSHYNHLNSLRARYIEQYRGLGLTRTESGTLLLKRPGRMLWQYDQPRGKVFVLDGKYAWFYTPGDAQASRAPAKQLDDLRTPLRFLLGHTELQKELDGVAVESHGDAGFGIAGVPRGMQSRLRQLRLEVNAAGQITHMQMEETDGAVTKFTFSNIEENVPVKDGDFTFTPPPGVTVVNALPPI